MENKSGFEIEIPILLKNGIPKIVGIYGIQNKHIIFFEQTLTHEEKRMSSQNYKYYNFENEIEDTQLIKNLKTFVLDYDFTQLSFQDEALILEFVVDFKHNFYFKGSYLMNDIYYNSARSLFGKYFINSPKHCLEYVELLQNVVTQTDNENWDYFSENLSVLAKVFLDYGYFSRVIMMRDYENNIEIPVGYVQLRILKNTAPQLLYKDFYHHAGLSGSNLWEKSNQLKAGLPIYVDVIAVKKEYQHNLSILKLVPEAIQNIIEEIHEITQEMFDIYAVGVTNEGRKMCEILGMTQLSEITRTENNIKHTRTLFRSEYLDFTKRLKKICK